MEMLLKLPELIEKSIPPLKRIRDQYPAGFRWALRAFIIGVAGFILFLGFREYVFRYPKWVVATYIRSISLKDFKIANTCLEPALAQAWKPNMMEWDYRDLDEHFSPQIRLDPETPDPFTAWINGELSYDVEVGMRVHISREELEYYERGWDKRRERDILFAQLLDKPRYDQFRSEPGAKAIEVAFVSTRRWTLRRFGFTWRITGWKKPLNDKIVY